MPLNPCSVKPPPLRPVPTLLTDPRSVQIHNQKGDMLGRVAYENSADAGETWTLLDVAGQPVRQWKSGDLS
ncbi:hypothetical protein L6R53_33520, partial [Myxococcota bacterium]|nr:hypothetical protein [Myxococcota bacterium]